MKRGPTTVGNENSNVRLDVLDADLDRRARHQVGERLREDVGPLLVEERRHLAGLARRLVDAPRLLAALDLAMDGTLSGAHRHGVHRGAVGEREAVEGLHRLREAAREQLRHRDPGDEARDLDRDLGVPERAGAERLAARPDRVERARPGDGLLLCARGTAAEEERREDRHGHCEGTRRLFHRRGGLGSARNRITVRNGRRGLRFRAGRGFG